MSRLGDEDKRAVDLVLDHAGSAHPTTGQCMMYAVPGQDGFDRRVKSVEKLLRLLDAMRVDDPPADLALRTLDRIENRGYERDVSRIIGAQEFQPGQKT